MGVLAPVLATDGSVARALDDRYYGGYPGAGMPTTLTEAMTIPAFYAGVAYVSEDTGKMPLSMFEDMGEEGRQPARDHELQELLHDQPNQYQDAIEWREMGTAIAMLRGKVVNEKRYGPSSSYPAAPTRAGRLTEIVPLHPDLIREDQTRSGVRRYQYRDPHRGFQERTILVEEAFTVRGRLSQSVLEFATRNLGTILATDRYAHMMFSRGAKHSGAITHPSKMSEPVRSALRKAIDEYSIDGPRAGRPLLLEDGMTWQDVSMKARDAELLASQQWSVSQVCRWIRIPPHKVFDLTRSTNNNIETQGVDYVTDSLLGWSLRWEQAIWRDLITDKRFFAKHNLDVFLRGDIETRYKAYAYAIQWGWMSRNEVREKEDLNRKDGYDELLTPTNMTTNADGSVSVDYAQKPTEASAIESVQIEAGDERSLLRLFAADKAGMLVRREVATMSTIAKKAGDDRAVWRASVEAEYGDAFAQRLATDLHIPEFAARRYATEQRTALVEGGPSVMNEWLTDRVAVLTDLALKQPEVERAA